MGKAIHQAYSRYPLEKSYQGKPKKLIEMYNYRPITKKEKRDLFIVHILSYLFDKEYGVMVRGLNGKS